MDVEKIEKLGWVLTDLITDLGTCSKFYLECQKIQNFDPINNTYHLGMLRMCHMNSIISLSKLTEVLNGYAREVKLCSEQIISKAWQHKEKIELKDVYAFRSKYVAHVFDKETSEPLSLKLGYERLVKIVGNTPLEVNEYYNWISNVAEPADDIVSMLLSLNSELCALLEYKPVRV